MVEGRPALRTGKLCYMEIPAIDVARSAEFYRQAFGWTMRVAGDGSTSFDDTVNEVSGTFVLGRPPATEPGFLIYIMVAEAGAALDAVTRAGGEIVRPVDPAAGEVFAWFCDPGGNVLGIYQQPGLAQPEAAAPEDEVDLQKMLDLATPWCLHVAVTLRIPEHIAAGRRFIDLDGIGGRMAHTWGTLLDYVRTGQPAYEQVFGRPFWADLAAHPRIAADFDALMGPAGHGVPDYDIELSGGWATVRTVVDVGGGTGAMLASLLRRHPEVRGILVDLPGAVARSGETFTEAGVASRVTVTGQNFFDPLPAGADLYLLKSVLNDWPDEPTVAILRRCAEAARPGGSIAVLGGVSADEMPRSLGIDMLVAGGKTSTLKQFTELAHRAGLDILAAGTQSSGRYVVECRPRSTQPSSAGTSKRTPRTSWLPA
jgi:2,7-dihydroxy-5-methyl-1-naphthoate 7-O-methyltransferase